MLTTCRLRESRSTPDGNSLEQHLGSYRSHKRSVVVSQPAKGQLNLTLSRPHPGAQPLYKPSVRSYDAFPLWTFQE